jgi:putative glutamine amidotransferase
MNRPLIALTAIPKPASTPMGWIPHQTLNDLTFEVVWAAGGAPVLVPIEWADPEAVLSHCDAILLTGGGDVDPELYGSDIDAEDVYRARDEFELELSRRALERDVPLLAICRGHQVLNVALGGTLTSTISSSHWDTETWQNRSHAVTVIDPESRIASLFGSSVEVNSIHHQAIERTGELHVVARSADGVVEAAEVKGGRFAVAVQWHPEFMTRERPEQQRLFDALVQVAAERKAS